MPRSITSHRLSGCRNWEALCVPDQQFHAIGQNHCRYLQGKMAGRTFCERPPAKSRWLHVTAESRSFRLKTTYSTLKSSSGSSGFWFLMYSFQTSSVTLPLDATQYPLAHKCWPQYRFLSEENSDNSLCELFPFRNCTALDTDKFGGIPISRCT